MPRHHSGRATPSLRDAPAPAYDDNRQRHHLAKPKRWLDEAGHLFVQSMSRRGNCLDNAPMERFFASLKKKHVHQVRYRTREEARAAVFDYIEIFCNRQRLHSGLGYRTPVQARASMEEVTMLAAA